MLQLQQHVFGAAHAAVEQLAHEGGAHCEQQAEKQGDSRVQQHLGADGAAGGEARLMTATLVCAMALHAALVDALGHGVVGALGVFTSRCRTAASSRRVLSCMTCGRCAASDARTCATRPWVTLLFTFTLPLARAVAASSRARSSASRARASTTVRVVPPQAGGQLLDAAFFARHVALAGDDGVVQHPWISPAGRRPAPGGRRTRRRAPAASRAGWRVLTGARFPRPAAVGDEQSLPAVAESLAWAASRSSRSCLARVSKQASYWRAGPHAARAWFDVRLDEGVGDGGGEVGAGDA